jgi:hypothetical protein
VERPAGVAGLIGNVRRKPHGFIRAERRGLNLDGRGDGEFGFTGCYDSSTIGEEMIKLELSIEEVNAILQVLGDLPSKTGAWPLIVKIKEQAEPQVPKPDDVTEQ